MKSAPPTVVHVIYALGTGGLENGLVNLINRAAPDRYRHAIICLTTSGDFAARITTPNVPVLSLHKRPGHDLRVYWRMWRALRQLRPAVMHTRNLAALEMHLIGLLRPGLRRIHGEHGRDVYDLDGSNTRYQRLRRALAPFLHRFITVSADLRDWLVNDVGIAAKQVIQIYNGVDQQVFKPCEAGRPELAPVGFGGSDQRLIGTVGRLAEVKDQATLLKATRLLLEQRPTLRTRVRVVIVGDGPLRAALQRQVEESGLADVVWLAGDRDDVPALLQMMDVFVLPSLAEGISNTVLEAMASGLPIVATDTGGNPELVEPAVNGYLFPVGDAQALAAMLGKLIDDDALVRAMGAAARTRVEQRFDWQRTVEQYLGVYDEALGLPSRQ